MLEQASIRGTILHQLFSAYALGLPILEIPEGLEGYFKSFQIWFDAMVEEVILAEEQLFDDVYHFSGTPDIVCRLRGDDDLALGDWKSGQVASKGWRLQTSAYRYLAEKKTGRIIKRTFSLQPKPDGKRAAFREYTRSLTHDFSVFLAGLTWWKYFNE